MNDQKMDNLLNLAMDATEAEREKSRNLEVGYDEANNLWDIIVKYSGDAGALEGPGILVTPLLGGYAIVTLPAEELETYTRRPQVEYVEKPVRLYFEILQAKEASCIRSVQIGREGLTGRGILVGIVDSGVDYRHPDFQNPDGSTRILRLWDQGIPGRPPQGYLIGTEYTKEEIDEALALSPEEGRRLVPSSDTDGHGTAVLGIAAGSGLGRDDGSTRGVAYESDLLVVKMGNGRANSFPRTTELMQGVDYLIKQSLALGRPMVLNLSFGNNYGSHRGDSLLETYLDNAAGTGRTVICTGTGNNGNAALHTGGRMETGETKEVELGVGAYEPTLNLQLWKAYEDQMDIYVEAPSGSRIGPLYENLGPQRYRLNDTELLIYYGKPGPYYVRQEIYFDFLASGTYVDSGIWKLILRGRNVRNGEYDLWLPGGNVLGRSTGFFMTRAEETLTIPSTARRVISVAAYDSRLDAYADFSGRGGDSLPIQKPDLAAPGINILAPRAGGGYASFTGSSFAVPLVSGAAALLMQWGIENGNDPYLYGEKVKAYLRRGAGRIPAFEEYPNNLVGYGKLCVRESLPEI